MLHKMYRGNLKQRKTINGHNTRSKFTFHVQFCTWKKYGKYEDQTILYNKVPGNINNGITLNSLKELQSLLLNHSFYSVDKFYSFG
jgi:hypothetical protein